MLDISATSLRRWAIKFEAHLSNYTRLRHRKYTAGDVAVLNLAQRLLGDGFTYEKTNRLLYASIEERTTDLNEIRKTFPEIPTYLHLLHNPAQKISSDIEQRDKLAKTSLVETNHHIDHMQLEQQEKLREELLQFWVTTAIISILVIIMVFLAIYG